LANGSLDEEGNLYFARPADLLVLDQPWFNCAGGELPFEQL
jgi:hypothetical protein